MAIGSVADFRLVRCPRCLQILPELLHVSLYECGGCGTHLQGQAKVKKIITCLDSSSAREFLDSSGTEQDQILPGDDDEEQRGGQICGDGSDKNGSTTTWKEEEAQVSAGVHPSMEMVPMKQEEPMAGAKLEVEEGNGCFSSGTDTSASVVKPSTEKFSSAILKHMLKSPATRSSRVYYNGGLSFHEAKSEKLPHGYKNLHRSTSERQGKQQFLMKRHSKSVLSNNAFSRPTNNGGIPPPVVNRKGFGQDQCCPSSPFSPYQISTHSGLMISHHHYHRHHHLIANHDPNHVDECDGAEKMRMCFDMLDQHDTDCCCNGSRAMDCTAYHGRFNGGVGNHHQHGQRTHCFHGSNKSGRAFSSSSSQLHAETSEFLRCGSGRKVEDEVQKDGETRREKTKSCGRYLLPIAGGAPLITCGKCSTLLQLPADFLINGRKCHMLRCGSCSKLLKFSLESRTHLLPRKPAADAPPPSQVDSDGTATGRRRRSLASSSAADEKATSSTMNVNPTDRGSLPLHKLMGYSSVHQLSMGGGACSSRTNS